MFENNTEKKLKTEILSRKMFFKKINKWHTYFL